MQEMQVSNGWQTTSKEKVNIGLSASKKLITSLLFLFISLAISEKASAKAWVLQNSYLKVTFNEQSKALFVFDKRSSKTWQQFPFSANFLLKDIVQKKNSLELTIDGQFNFQAIITLTDSAELVFSIQADSSQTIHELNFPAAFKSDPADFIVLTDGEGILLPTTDKTYPVGNGITYYCGGGLSMSWMGVTDKNYSTGYMLLLETPYDAAIRTKRVNEQITFEPVWLSSKEKFGYNRKLRYIFFDKGGYVAQCKRYRNYIWPVNKVITLKEHAKKIPSIDKMIGGVHIYVWDNARNASFANELKQSGINKAMFIWNPNHLPYPSFGYNDSLKSMGFAVGSYELFTDENWRDTAFYDLSASANYLKRNAFPGMFNQLVARKKDGTTYSNQFGHYTNPKAVFPEVMKRTSKEMTIWPHETFFVDVCQANGLYECYSKENPLTREQWANAHRKTLQTLIDTHHVFLGAEWGADFAVAQSVYAHGMMTLQRTWFNSDIQNKGTIYYYGNWKNGQRPSIMLGTRTAPPTYLQYSINEYSRVPLYELVYHDAVVTSWRWEDANHHTPEIWWKKDLFNILYGTAPLWTLDQERWDAFKNTFVKSFKQVSTWLQQIGYDEMIDHRFITKDHSIQEVVFSSGKRVIVNFGDQPFNFQTKIIEAKGVLFL